MEDKHKMENAYDLETKYMTQQEVADLFRVRPGTIKNWRDAGLLEYLQPPGSTRVLYQRNSVEELEKNCT
ncbi:MAG: helix-turn-helix domain-containing protein, partial [Desulfatiglandaceae bacterium]